MTSDDIAAKKYKYYEALCYSYKILSYNYSGLYEKCINIELGGSLIPALSQAWNIINTIHHIRELSSSTPCLNNKDQSLKKFLQATSLVKDYRNYIQHLRGELHELGVFHVYGTLSWASSTDDKLSHLVVIGKTPEGTRHSSMVYDTHDQKWVDRVSLSINNTSCHFDFMYNATTDFKDTVLDALGYQDNLFGTEQIQPTVFSVLVKDKR